jgi:hypothetical protein
MPDSSAAPASNGSSALEGRFDLAQLKREFAEEGFVVLRGVVSKEELARVELGLRGAYDDWQRSSEAFRGGGLMSGHLNCYPGNLVRGAVDELRSRGILELSNALFPTHPRAVRVGLNFNLPGSVAQHYHMDGLYLESFAIVNVAVVDTTLHNGAIDVIPKTQKRFYKYWEFATGRVYRGAQRLEMERGDVLLRVSTLWHRGMPNFSSSARPMLAVTLGEKHVDTDDPFAYREGRVEFQPNWFNSSFLGRLREQTFVKAPITYSAYRFARSLVGNKGYATF